AEGGRRARGGARLAHEPRAGEHAPGLSGGGRERRARRCAHATGSARGEGRRPRARPDQTPRRRGLRGQLSPRGGRPHDPRGSRAAAGRVAKSAAHSGRHPDAQRPARSAPTPSRGDARGGAEHQLAEDGRLIVLVHVLVSMEPFLTNAKGRPPPGKRPSAWCGVVPYWFLRTFCAWSPFGPFTMSNSTRSPSASDRKPSIWMAVWWTNTSSPPSCEMKPKPLLSL